MSSNVSFRGIVFIRVVIGAQRYSDPSFKILRGILSTPSQFFILSPVKQCNIQRSNGGYLSKIPGLIDFFATQDLDDSYHKI